MTTRQLFEITYRDKFDSKKKYNKLDIIKFMGEFYVCTKDGTVGISPLNLECFHKLEFLDEQEPCGDTISRQAVNVLVDELARAISDERCCMPRGRSTATIMQDILALPPVTPQPDWIPVSRDLPKEKDGSVLVTMPDKKVRTARYSEFSGKWYVGDMMGVGGPEPIAWMLPIPYEPQEGAIRNEI